MIDLLKRLYKALQTFLGNVATTDSVSSAIETAVEGLDIPTDQEIQGMIDTSIGALDIPTDQDIQGLIDDDNDIDTTGAVTYSEYAQATNSTDGVKVFKYKNGWKRVVGLLNIIDTLPTTGRILFTVPDAYKPDVTKNGGIQPWSLITNSTNTSVVRIDTSSGSLYVYAGGAVGNGYVIDILYR